MINIHSLNEITVQSYPTYNAIREFSLLKKSYYINTAERTGSVMPKNAQKILLMIVILVAFAARLSVLGWLFVFAFASIIIMGSLHLFTHTYARNYLATKPNISLPLLLVSHLSFLNIFLFQSDGGDARGYVVLEYLFGPDFLFGIIHQSEDILWSSLIINILSAVTIIVFAYNEGNGAAKPALYLTVKVFGILLLLISILLFYLL